jgi:hypothetical protein
MKALPPELERKIVDALTAPENGWMTTWQQSYDIIRGQYACSVEKADRILGDLYAKRKRIVFVRNQNDGPPFPYKWKRAQP